MVDTRALRALVRKGVGVRLSPAAQPGPIGKWHTVSMGRTERERGRPAASGSETAVVELHWAVSSVGRAPRLQRGGRRFKSCTVHLMKHYYLPSARLTRCDIKSRAVMPTDESAIGKFESLVSPGSVFVSK